MLNQDIINEYLKNRDALSSSWSNFNLFSPQSAQGYTNTFTPQKYEPTQASMYPISQAIAASPSLANLDPGSFVGGDSYTPGNPVYSRSPMEIVMEYARMGGPIGGIVRGAIDTIAGDQQQGQMPPGYSGSPVDFGLDSPGGYSGPSPIGLPGYSGTTVDFGLDAPSVTSPDIGWSDSGWGSGYGDGAY